MSLISIQIKDIPDYLKTSDFYNNLDVNEYKIKNDTITIPSINFKKDCKRLVNPSVKYYYFECVKYCLENGGKLSSTSYVYLLRSNHKNKESEKIKKYIYENYDKEAIIKEEDELCKQLNGYISDEKFDY